MKTKEYMNLQLFAMKNADTIEVERKELSQKFQESIKSGDPEQFAQSLTEFGTALQESIMQEARSLVNETDVTVLASRGIRQLTSQETKFYQKTIEAMRSSNPKQALTDLAEVMPVTTIDAVFDELILQHPLLEVVDFVNTSGLIEYIVNTNAKQASVWGALTSEIIKELTSGFKTIKMDLEKLSSFIPIAKSMLDLGPVWVDKYIRTILAESLSCGLEEGIVNGTGKDMPIGMNRQVGTGVVVTDGVYPVKATVAVTSLDPVSYGALLATMAVDSKGNSRIVTGVTLIVNPIDYLTKIMPATTIRASDGTYVNNIFPVPTKVIQSVEVPTGKAIFGLTKRYFMGIGMDKSGKLEYSDEYKFLEDQRYYLIKTYGHGEPLDNTAFIYADISALVPAIQEVTVSGTVATDEVV